MSSVQEPASVSNGNNGPRKISKDAGKAEIQLDIPKLHSLPSEQQDLYLFTFINNLESYTNSLDLESLRSQQAFIQRELLQVIALPTPSPTRVIRNSLGRCFRRLFGNGDRKLLFEAITLLGDSLGTGKVEKDFTNKQAAVYCLGEIYRVAGDGAVSLSSTTCSAISRLLKSAAGHVALRTAVFRSLGKIVAAVQGSLEETVARDIWRQARNAASVDRGALAQTNACWCLEQLVKCTTYFESTNDFESLKTTLWKAGDSPYSKVRHASASCLASIMIKGYSETTTQVPIPRTPRLKKNPRKPGSSQGLTLGDGEDSDSMRLASPTWRKSSAKLELTLIDILQQLSSQYLRASTTNRSRVAIILCYTKVFLTFESRLVEANYGVITEHLLVDVLNSPLVAHHRFRLLFTRRCVQQLLAGIIGRHILGEAARVNAARILINDYVKNYPAVIKETPEPSKNALVGALSALASIIHSLGCAFPLSDSCRDGLLQVLQHPSYTVQIHASYCIRLLAIACPSQLIQCASICLNSLNRELGLLGSSKLSARRCTGYANGLAAAVSVSRLQPLYSSLEISSRVLQQATNLLKASVNSELRISATQVQVAWILIGGLMSLGPNFVKIHLSQLLLLWRNSLHKENAGQHQIIEISYLIHVRECALGSILSFLEFNGRLLTSDVSKRIATMLQNTIEFLAHLPADKLDGEMSPRIVPSLQPHEMIQMVRRRILQCLTRLAIRSPHTSKEILSQSSLIGFAVSCFAEPEGYIQGSLGSSIANSASNFESIWEVADNYGFGISSLMKGLHINLLPTDTLHEGKSHRLHHHEADATDQILLSPICGAREHDSVYIHLDNSSDLENLPDPPATEVVNSSINLFAVALSLQSPTIQESVLEQLSTYLTAKSLQRDPGRRAAITVNIALALLGALRVTMNETLATLGDIKSPAVEKCLDELLRTLLIDPDQRIRNAACEAVGRLCYGSGNPFTAGVVHSLIETIVANREPHARAGCAMALGSIHSNVGGMAASFHLRKIHGVLMSLCSDPHPAVHFWAIEALSQVTESAGLSFSGYIPSTLGLLAQLWISDSHCEEADAIGTSNAELEFVTPAAIAHNIAALINVLGPDFQDIAKARDLIFTLVRQFDVDDLPVVQGQALRCWEYICLYAPTRVDLPRYVHQIQRGLEFPAVEMREIAADGLYNLMRRNVENTLEIAGNSVEDQIWKSIDSPYDQTSLRSVVELWIKQTSLTQTATWISRCQSILTKTVSKPNEGPNVNVTVQPTTATEVLDDEVAGFTLSGNAKDEDAGDLGVGQELLKWQTRAFALKCLSAVVAAGARDLRSNPQSRAGLVLQQRVSDLIRMAFLSSTSSVVELRVGGLRLIDQILMVFGKTSDPDFTEALLLEQYQAQITSALAPAFGVDSSPELAAVAINVCATFIATGLVKDVEKMGRILKLLVSALTSFTADESDIKIGEFKSLSANAQIMVKLSVLSAWAELQVASTEQPYLIDVVKPHIGNLTPLWLSSLQEFARLRFEPDISSSIVVSPNDNLDVIYAALNRQTLLQFYQNSWLKLVEAIASLIDQDTELVFDALDGKLQNGVGSSDASNDNDISYRDEPVAFFFILYGIAFEAIMKRTETNSEFGKDQTLEILLALERILRPSVVGRAIYQDVVFSETMDLFDRLALTEGLAIQAVVVQITRNLCLAHPSTEEDVEPNEHLSEDIEQLFELTRIIVLVLANILPDLGHKTAVSRKPLADDAIALVISSLEALVDASEVFPSVIRTDLHACIIHIFTTILRTDVCQSAVVPRALVTFKRFVRAISEDVDDNPATADQLKACLQIQRSILTVAQRREAETSLQCAKNTLMASVILLTNASEAINSKEVVLTHILDDLIDSLQDLGLGNVAANCGRSLLVNQPKSETGQAIAQYLFPRLVQYVLDDAQSDPEGTKSIVLQAVVLFASTLNGENAITAFCIVIPLILHRAARVGRDSHEEMAGKLLSLGSANQGAFRLVAGHLNTSQRNLLEEVLKQGATDQYDARGNRVDKTEPTIALKLTFGAA